MQDSIIQAEAAKDSTIVGFVFTMNEIQQNLDSIRKIEEFVKLETARGAELTSDARSNILDDITLIHELLTKNKVLVAQLQEDLKSSNNQVSGLQKTILYLNKQINEKDAQIAQLTHEVEKLHKNIVGLSTRVRQVEKESSAKDALIAEKEQAIKEKNDEMNQAYYVLGNVKDLVEKKIVEKKGGVLGVGRTIKFRRDFNPELFTEVDIREFEGLELNAKKASVITTHTIGSYELSGDTLKSLVVHDADKFWETSKYLVVVVN